MRVIIRQSSFNSSITLFHSLPKELSSQEHEHKAVKKNILKSVLSGRARKSYSSYKLVGRSGHWADLTKMRQTQRLVTPANAC